MKLMKFTFLSLFITSSLMVELNAQERGGRGEGQRNVGVRPNVESNQRPQRNDLAGVRMDQSNRGKVDTKRPNTQIVNNSVANPKWKEPVKINNSKQQWSYSKPVKNFDNKKFNSYHFNNVNFYGQNGIYYRKYNNDYVRFMPPVGFKVNVLPPGFISLNLGSRPYYFYEGIYYEKYRNEYRVVEPQMGAIVQALPYGYEKVDYYGQHLYEYGGILYDKIYHRGERVYQVVGYVS